MIVLDTSAVLELVLNLPLGGRVTDRISDPESMLHAPQLLTIEVLHVLRRRVATGSSTASAALHALELLGDLDASHHDHLSLVHRTWTLRRNLTAYNAAYVALAEALDATLVTTGTPLARSPGHGARIDLIGG